MKCLLNYNLENINITVSEPFTLEEITKGIKKLKNNKACGSDLIINEFIKNSPHKFIVLITEYFNVILNTGIVPSDWCLGVIQPIFKNKGTSDNPDNYRGITLLSCMSKLFTLLINDRLNAFLESNDFLGNEQAGFRQGFSTIDHLYTMFS